MGEVIEGGNVKKVLLYGLLPNAKPWPLQADSQGRLVLGQVGIDQTTPAVTNRVHDGWTPSPQADVAADDSDKLFVVPASTEWQVCTVYISLTTTGTAGDRQLCVVYTDSAGNVLAEARAGAVQAANLTRTYNFGLGVADLTSFRDTNHLTTPLPVVVLPAGAKVRVYDSKAIAAAADDMTVRLLVMARSV